MSDLMTEWEDLRNTPEEINAAVRPPAVPTGTYTGQIVSCERRAAGEMSPWPGRKMANFRVTIKLEDGTLRTIFFEASPVKMTRETASGAQRPDQAYQLWAQLSKAVDGADKSAVEVMDLAGRYPLQFALLEVAEGPKETPFRDKIITSAAQRVAASEAGYATKNYVNSVKAAR